MVEQNEPAIVFKVQVDGQERKVIDLLALKHILQGNKLRYSMLSLDPRSVNPDEPIMMYMAKAAYDVLNEIEDMVDEVLGLKGPAPKQEEPETEPEPQTEAQPKQETEPEPQAEAQPKPESEPEDVDEKIIL